MFDLDRLCMGCMRENEGEEVCPLCGFDSNAPTPAHALALKTVLQGRYIVGKMLIYGGDGITYIGFDKQEEKIVRIKEYYPSGVCQRKDGLAVRVKKESAFAYNSGIMEFLELSDKLESLSDLPGIFPVINVFEENGTAYRVTEYTHGINLRDFLLRNGGTLTWEQAKPLFLPLISTMMRLHKVGIIHRGISPETLIIGRDGKLRITDFSIAAVRTKGGELAPLLYAGYAALEQYGHEKAKEDGTFTDVYSLAATMFKTLIGNPPPEATQRVNGDNMSIPKRVAEAIPQSVLIALANALQIFPEDRTANMQYFKEDLTDEDEELYVSDSSKKAEVKSEKSEEKVGPKFKKSDKMYAIKAAIITAVSLILVVLIIWISGSIFGGNKNDSSKFEGLSSVDAVSVKSETVSHAEKLYAVPDLTGKTFYEVMELVEYKDIFTFKIEKKEFSSSVEKGKVVSQSVKKDENKPKGTEILLTISLGPESFKVPYSLKGMTKTKAYITLLELGVEPTAIEFIEKNGATATKEKTVLETVPAMGSEITQDSRITVYINKNIIKETTPSSSEVQTSSEAE